MIAGGSREAFEKLSRFNPDPHPQPHNIPSVYNTIVRSRDTRMTAAASRDQNQSGRNMADAGRKLLAEKSNLVSNKLKYYFMIFFTSLSFSLYFMSCVFHHCGSFVWYCVFFFFFFFRISSSHIVNSVCWSHALVNVPTSKRPASDGGRCSGQLLMMWSAVCSGSPHSHAALSTSPHFFMDAL